MKKGDILLIQSKFDPIGWVIRKGIKGNFNHVAWALDDKILVEIGANGKRVNPLKKYQNKFLYKCKLIRPNLVKCKTNEALRRANQAELSYPYLSAILNFVLIKLKMTKKAPKLSCSSFIGYYMAQVGFYFNEDHNWLITPKEIATSKKVKDVSKEL